MLTLRNRRGTLSLLGAIAILTGTTACDRGDPVYELSGATMGTSYSVKLVDPPASLDRTQLGHEIGARLDALEQSMSTYRNDSELSLFNVSQSTEWITVSAELCVVVDAALAVSRHTDGAFDVTIGPLVNLWGFGPDSDRTEPPTASEIDAARQRVGYVNLDSDCSAPALRKKIPELYVDLSAFAKGYGVDILAELLDAQAVTNYLVEIGGELRLRGKNANGQRWAIAIETPARSGRAVQSVIGLSNTAMATSGDYRNYFEHDGRFYSHTIDPSTGYPVSHGAASVTVVAAEAAKADALATALLVKGPDSGFAYAEANDIAAYFLLRTAAGVEERATRRFVDDVERR